MGKALYRRYRSRSLAEVVGQRHITNALEKALRDGKVGHAYLLVGPRGTGKTSVARILAHEINGFPYELEDDYLDIIEIDAASNTGVDNIRDLREKAVIAPTKGKYKVYIIDEVHMLSKSAFNALLKTLEEPPEHVVFIMATTDAHKVPVTIRSRSQTLVFKLADVATMVEYLRGVVKTEGMKIDDSALELIARRGGGSFRDTISLLDQISGLTDELVTAELIERALGLPADELIQKLYDSYTVSDAVAVRLMRELLDQGVKPEVVAEELMAKIVAAPRGELLPLLEKLSEVPRAAYPEVKLLLALTAGSSAIVSVKEYTSKSSSVNSDAGLQGDFAVRDDGGDEDVAAACDDTPAPAPFSEKPVAELAKEEFSEEALLEVARKEGAGVAKLLELASYELADGKLRIYAGKKFAKDQLEKKRGFILENLPDGVELEIVAGVKYADATMGGVAELMGGGEEVKI